MNVLAQVWSPDSTIGPGRLELVRMTVSRAERSRLALPGVEVEDVRGGVDLACAGEDLRFDPAGGGGPHRRPDEQRDARRFGIVNAAFHVRRGLDQVEALLGRRLPPVVVKIGMHRDQRSHWGGGHYRLPARAYAGLPEDAPPSATGEIHLGCGHAFGTGPAGPYFLAPAHNLAILYHELGHHVTRHTADFRVNARRPPDAQTNHKIPLDEGTADYLTGVILERADIFGWHRAGVPTASMRRRSLDATWTMAAFRGGADVDPHIDGTIWAAALWATRTAVERGGHAASTFDALVLDGLDRVGCRILEPSAWEVTLRRRRYFAGALAAILKADEARQTGLGAIIEASFAARGIEVGFTNAQLRDRSRAAAMRERVATGGR